MEINVRRIDGRYRGVSIEHDNMTYDLGILDEDECMNLAQTLESAVDELTEDWG